MGMQSLCVSQEKCSVGWESRIVHVQNWFWILKNTEPSIFVTLGSVNSFWTWNQRGRNTLTRHEVWGLDWMLYERNNTWKKEIEKTFFHCVVPAWMHVTIKGDSQTSDSFELVLLNDSKWLTNESWTLKRLTHWIHSILTILAAKYTQSILTISSVRHPALHISVQEVAEALI